MPFEPDIIVTDSEGSVALVAEAKTILRDLAETERQLKRYMVGMRCPVGLIVTPQTLCLYTDQYLSTSEDSVRSVATFDITNVLRFEPAHSGKRDEYAFEEAVQSWLENLTLEPEFRRLPENLAQAIQNYVLPALFRGAVRAAHPRHSLIAG
jgi:hypothetical protein